ncbi:PEGA domain-containing protein [Thermococcus sp. SY098]|uniref:PEGA domain-containing protein n=1 Tax=Thermococcus sp. SY098 TaxID=3111325 RepID=UPI002D7708C4|nr:PEGA domain-containing protein [Thermococcus sp. SY098]WRS51878.1 PEGA domain-containing protein [Thermococcus sp. SY098]
MFRKEHVFTALIMFLLTISAFSSVSAFGNENIVLQIDSRPSNATIIIEGINKTFKTPALIELPAKNWIIRISSGNYTVLYNLVPPENERFVKIAVYFGRIDLAVKGPFKNITVEYGFNSTVPTKEDEYVPPIAAPFWDEEVCGGIIMFGPKNPPMVIYKYDDKDPYYQLFLNSTPSVEEYRGRKGCKMMEMIFYFDNDSAMARGFPYRKASFIVSHSLLSIDSQPENATVYIFDFHRFGEWFTPFDVLVPVVMEPQRNVSIVHYDFELGNLTTTVIPYIPELHAYKVSMGHNGYPFLEGWLELKPNQSYSIRVNFNILRSALTVNGEEVKVQVPKTKKINYYLPNTTLLIINSTIALDVYIDGSYVGRTPFKDEVPSGEHDILLKFGSYVVYHKKLDIGYGGRFRLTVIPVKLLKILNVPKIRSV